MSVFYNNYVALCNKVGKSPSAVALEIGLSKTAVHGWKTKKSNPTDATIQKVADYFEVPVSALVSEQKENPTVSGEVNYSDMQLLSAFKSADEATQELIRRALGLK